MADTRTTESKTDGSSEPRLYNDASVWSAAEMRSSDEWEIRLSSSEIAELETAAASSRGIPLVQLTRQHFELPTLGPRLLEIQRELIDGRGFVLIRGLRVDAWDRELVARIYFGIGAWIGDAVPQNAAGHILGHVKDIGHDPHDPEHRVYATNYRHLFHTDSCDVVGLLCLQPAKSGGLSAIVSSTALYNRIAETRPDLAEVLAQPFSVGRKGEIPVGKQPTYEMAIFHHWGDRLTTIYARDFIEAAQRFDDVPRLAPRQVEAMDLVDALAASDEFRLDMDFQPGDIQLLHNHQILHARTAYEDYPEPERKRHLLRLWLSVELGRELPPAFSERYGEIRRGKIRGGIRVPGQQLSAPLDVE